MLSLPVSPVPGEVVCVACGGSATTGVPGSGRRLASGQGGGGGVDGAEDAEGADAG